LLFWLVGVALFLLTRPPTTTTCAPGYAAWWCDLKAHGPFGVGVVVAIAIAAVVATTTLIAALAPVVTDIALATNWPGRRGLRRLGAWLTRRHHARRAKLWEDRAAAAKLTDAGTAAAAEGLVWKRIRSYPREEGEGDLIGPTATGNALRAVMQRVRSWSGLDLSACWRPLLLVLPAEVRTSLGNAATAVFTRAQLLLLSVSSVVWWPLIGWCWALLAAVLLTVGCVVVALRGLRLAVAEYLEEVEMCVLIHRMALYDSLSFKRPADSSSEAARGIELTNYLQRTNSDRIWFT
jgi:hypothetical protein